MNLKIKTKDIELEYSDDNSMVYEDAKTRILAILDKAFEKQSMLESFKPIHNPKCKYCGGEDKGQ